MGDKTLKKTQTCCPTLANPRYLNCLIRVVTLAAAALLAVGTAITQLAGDRATQGANSTRLNYVGTQLSVYQENSAAANSRIKDVDVAEESIQFARYNILVQSGVSMVAQANANAQSSLRLIF